MREMKYHVYEPCDHKRCEDNRRCLYQAAGGPCNEPEHGPHHVPVTAVPASSLVRSPEGDTMRSTTQTRTTTEIVVAMTGDEHFMIKAILEQVLEGAQSARSASAYEVGRAAKDRLAALDQSALRALVSGLVLSRR